MLQTLIIYGAVIVVIGIFSLFLRTHTSFRKYFAAAGISVLSLLTLGYLLWVFRGIRPDEAVVLTEWQLPFASLRAGMDSLSAFFLLPLLLLAVSTSLYGPQYFGTHHAGRSHWFFFSLLISAMVMVLLARNAVLFILAWEIMSLSSFFLVITDKKSPEAIRAGWIYFITAHVGTAFLLVLFFLLSSSAGSFDFIAWKGIHFSVRKADAVFVLALIAFGLKAGFIPFHVWLPLAHPTAPSHVSALMSGIMIKMGIYGLLRILTLIPQYHAWWGILLIALGAVSGVLGVLFAIGQHDIKKLLAYHSVENIGIILLGIGVGMTGAVYGSSVIALFGFAGALLHVVNHALFKGLLFLGAGAILRQTGSGEIDRLGGLIKKMPWTGLFFLIGAVAICGLPFFNGFISELLIYRASITGAMQISQTALSMASLAVIISLALIGGLAAACFTKVFGIVFLGKPRCETTRVSGEVPASMLWSMAFLAAPCIVIGICSVVVFPLVVRPAIMFAGSAAAADAHEFLSMTITISCIFGFFAAIALFVAGVIKIAGSKKRTVEEAVTWDCGYTLPGPSMQYTASSFASPIINHFKLLIGASEKDSTDAEPFPSKKWTFHSAVDDWFMTKIYEPLVQSLDRTFSSLRWFQNGKTGQYVFYIAVTVFCLIVWKFFL
jgi:hydrogenase-4 component B